MFTLFFFFQLGLLDPAWISNVELADALVHGGLEYSREVFGDCLVLGVLFLLVGELLVGVLLQLSETRSCSLSRPHGLV